MLLQKFAATLKKLSAQGAKKVDYGTLNFGSMLRPNVQKYTVFTLS